jgi:hypothetical protein
VRSLAAPARQCHIDGYGCRPARQNDGRVMRCRGSERADVTRRQGRTLTTGITWG